MKNLIQLKNITLSIQNKTILNNISLSIPKGFCVAIIGPSGSGKTSLLRTINGLIPNFYDGTLEGELLINNQNSKELEDYEISRMVGTVSQDPKSQFFTNNVQDELCFEMENYGYSQSEISNSLNRVVDKFNLKAILNTPLTKLSSGQKQRVAVASTCMANPDYFVFDEPSANLDLSETNRLNEVLHQLKKQHKTIVISEHRIYYLMDVVDQFIVVNNGTIESIYSPEEIRNLPESFREQLGIRTPNILSLKKANISQINDKKNSLEILSLDSNYYKNKIISGLNYSQHSGSVTALIGANGSGKTTLAKTLIGLQKEKNGTILLYNEKNKRKKRLDNIWMVMQETIYQVFADSVLNELTLKKEKSSSYLKKCHTILSELSLESVIDNHPASLSGGQRQRLTIGIGLLENRDFIILDEPTSGLDFINMKQVSKMLRDIANQGKSIIVITHDPEFIMSCCDSVALLESGQITKHLTLDDLSSEELINLMTF